MSPYGKGRTRRESDPTVGLSLAMWIAAAELVALAIACAVIFL